MKVSIFTWCFLIIPGFLFAQEGEPALASISYEFTDIQDTNQRWQARKEEMVVYLGQYVSVYKSLTLAKRMEEAQERMKEMGRGHGLGGAGTSIRISSPDINQEQSFLMPRENRLVMLDKIADAEYRIDLRFPAIDWVIGDETKEIGGYGCQQATGSFGGGDYTVWFSPELPVPFGPWKLHGLPGLILEAADSREEVFFTFQDFGKPEDSGLQVSFPSAAIKKWL